MRKEELNYIFPIDWTIKDLKHERLKLGLTQKDIADCLGVSEQSISKAELGHARSGAVRIAYGVIIERYRALKEGYLPAFRKIGTNEFKN